MSLHKSPNACAVSQQSYLATDHRDSFLSGQNELGAKLLTAELADHGVLMVVGLGVLRVRIVVDVVDVAHLPVSGSSGDKRSRVDRASHDNVRVVRDGSWVSGREAQTHMQIVGRTTAVSVDQARRVVRRDPVHH